MNQSSQASVQQASHAIGASRVAVVSSGWHKAIIANALESGELAEGDRQYLGQLVAAKTGVQQAEAEQRVTDTFNRLKQTLDQTAAKAKQVADDARKASALLALWLVVSLFVGAFVASLAATFGGRLRDSSVLANT